jgi:hypothetical protein
MQLLIYHLLQAQYSFAKEIEEIPPHSFHLNYLKAAKAAMDTVLSDLREIDAHLDD